MSTAVEQWSEFPSGTALVQHTPQTPDLATPQQIAAYARAFDDEAFVSSIMGEAMGKWFYEFKVAGKTVEGVSVVGAEEFARLRAEQGFPIRFPPGSISAEEVTQNGELGIRVTVVAREARSGADGLGMAFYPYMVERNRDGETVRVPDNMPDRKALSVAKRNAILDLIPQGTIIAVLKQRREIMAANERREDERVRAAVEGRRVGRGPEPRAIASGAEEPGATGEQANEPESVASVSGSPLCPKCGGGMFDNRLSKRNPKAPDYKCRDKSCDGVIWPSRGNASNTQGALPGIGEPEAKNTRDAVAGGL